MPELADLARWWRLPEEGERSQRMKANERGWRHSLGWLTCPVCASALMLVNWADEDQRRCFVRKLTGVWLVLASVGWRVNQDIRIQAYLTEPQAERMVWWKGCGFGSFLRFGCVFCCVSYSPSNSWNTLRVASNRTKSNDWINKIWRLLSGITVDRKAIVFNIFSEMNFTGK